MDASRLLVLSCMLVGCSAIPIFQSTRHHAMRGHGRHYTPDAEADRVNELPGAPNALDFGLFSGYVTVDESAGRALFYIFAEARSNSPDAPLLLWLNGGPGCSSIGGGFMSELGPYYPHKDGKSLQDNPYAWNKMANVLWLESPAFVGFSYSNTSSDAIVGDARTAVDARLFLLKWLKRFPQYANSDFYISGESYGGHYVPNLAWEIVQGNKRAEEAAAAVAADVAVSPGRGFINLKGFFVGNAWTDAYIDNKGALDYWWAHAMISDEAYQAIRDNCDFNVIGPLMRGSEAVTLPGTFSSSSSSAAAAGGGRGEGMPPAASTTNPPIHHHQQQQQGSKGGISNSIRSLLNGLNPSGKASSEGFNDNPNDNPKPSGLGHARVQGWTGWGSSSTTRHWEAAGGPRFSHQDDKEMICAKWLDIAFAEQGNINIYEIYADVCPRERFGSSSSSSSSKQPKYRGALLGYSTPAATISTQGDEGLATTISSSSSSSSNYPHRPPRYDPCIDGEVETYLNLPEVQKALHANQTVKLPGRWTDCTRLISYSREDLLSSMIPTYKKLLQTGLKIWVFSGDVDGIVPVVGSRRWISSLNLPIVKPWRAWSGKSQQVGGWRIDYQNLTFATVRNAGHMVPYVQPERAYHLLHQFLFEDRPTPTTAAAAPVAAE